MHHKPSDLLYCRFNYDNAHTYNHVRAQDLFCSKGFM